MKKDRYFNHVSSLKINAMKIEWTLFSYIYASIFSFINMDHDSQVQVDAYNCAWCTTTSITNNSKV